MASKKERILVPTYRMELKGYYLLLRLQMKIAGYTDINGVGKDFFVPETYQNSEKTFKALAKKDLLEKTDTDINVREGLQNALKGILQSAYCMNFQNEEMKKKGQIMSFFYGRDRYIGVLLDAKEATVVASEEAEAVYMAFEKIIEAKGGSSFQKENWAKLWDKEDAIKKPLRTAVISHSANRLRRTRSVVSMVADKNVIQIMREEDNAGQSKLNRETTWVTNWFGVVIKEMEKLKAIQNSLGGKAKPSPTTAPRQKTEYEQIIEIPNFPKNGFSFVFWYLKRIVLGIPGMLKQMAKKKFISVILYALWAAVLFFYNMWATCYINDTFDLTRRVRWGNITPYLMAGTLQTPNGIKGFDANWGRIDTSFLVWPLMMILTLIGRHLILQIKNRKLMFVSDLAQIPAKAFEFGKMKFGSGRAMWISVAITWVLGFLLMNPITIFLFALFALLIFAQEGNQAIQLITLWCSACGRKKIDAGLKKQPDSRNSRMLFFHFSWGFALYGIVSLLLWFTVDYNFWVRLVVTVLMLAFAVIQAFFPHLLSRKEAKQIVKNTAFLLICFAAAYFFSSKMGVVFADDGGWTESGGWPGILYNAGFSTILGLTAMTIVGAFCPVAFGTLLGIGLATGGINFGLGLMDNKVGDYIRKTERQYFFGPDENENKTLYCTIFEGVEFISGFLNPASGMGAGSMKLLQGGKIVGDLISTSGDVASSLADVQDYIDGKKTEGDLMLDALGLGLDFCGMKDDISDFGDLLNKIDADGSAYRYVKEQGLIDKYNDMMQEKNNKISDSNTDFLSQKQAAVNAESVRFDNKIAEIDDTIAKVTRGEVQPPLNVDADAYLSALNQTKATEIARHTDEVNRIGNDFIDQMRADREAIEKLYNKKEFDFLKDEVAPELVSKGYDIYDEYDSLKEFFETNFGVKADETQS